MQTKNKGRIFVYKKKTKMIKIFCLKYAGFIMSDNKSCEKITVKVIKKRELTQ